MSKQSSWGPAFFQNGIFRIVLIPGKPLVFQKGSASSSCSPHSPLLIWLQKLRFLKVSGSLMTLLNTPAHLAWPTTLLILDLPTLHFSSSSHHYQIKCSSMEGWSWPVGTWCRQISQPGSRASEWVCVGVCVHVRIYSIRHFAGRVDEPGKRLNQSTDQRSCRDKSLTKTGPEEGR